MLLTVGIGNTNTAVGLWQDENLTQVFRLPSNREHSSQQWATTLIPYLGQFSTRNNSIDAIACSVVPALTERVVHAITRILPETEVRILRSSNLPVLRVHYDQPETLGSDRYFGAVATWALYLRNQIRYTHAIQVDCGTATTFGIITREGDFLGGAILPGIGISMDALLSRTAQLPVFDLSDAPLIATNTVDALRAGLIYGFSAQIGGMIARYRQEIGSDARIITVATGGALPVITHQLPFDIINPDLVLHGLHFAYRAIAAPPVPPSRAPLQ